MVMGNGEYLVWKLTQHPRHTGSSLSTRCRDLQGNREIDSSGNTVAFKAHYLPTHAVIPSPKSTVAHSDCTLPVTVTGTMVVFNSYL